VTAVIQPHPDAEVSGAEVLAFVKKRLGSVKTPKQLEVWADLPRSRIGKVLKSEVKARLIDNDPE
jgi:fatty-acyl-CoA synthase